MKLIIRSIIFLFFFASFKFKNELGFIWGGCWSCLWIKLWEIQREGNLVLFHGEKRWRRCWKRESKWKESWEKWGGGGGSGESLTDLKLRYLFVRIRKTSLLWKVLEVFVVVFGGVEIKDIRRLNLIVLSYQP